MILLDGAVFGSEELKGNLALNLSILPEFVSGAVAIEVGADDAEGYLWAAGH